MILFSNTSGQPCLLVLVLPLQPAARLWLSGWSGHLQPVWAPWQDLFCPDLQVLVYISFTVLGVRVVIPVATPWLASVMLSSSRQVPEQMFFPSLPLCSIEWWSADVVLLEQVNQKFNVDSFVGLLKVTSLEATADSISRKLLWPIFAKMVLGVNYITVLKACVH